LKKNGGVWKMEIIGWALARNVGKFAIPRAGLIANFPWIRIRMHLTGLLVEIIGALGRPRPLGDSRIFQIVSVLYLQARPFFALALKERQFITCATINMPNQKQIKYAFIIFRNPN
jgi:hypothetical protein